VPKLAGKKNAPGFRTGAFKEKRKNSVATNVVPVDPNPVVIAPRPVAWNPVPTMAMAPIVMAVMIVIVRSITDFDIDTCRFRSGHRSKRACAEQNAQQDHQISFHIVF
jgi:hypothetical protein